MYPKKTDKKLRQMHTESNARGEDDESQPELPYATVTQLKILGVTIDQGIGFVSHMSDRKANVRVRQNIHKRVGGSTGCAEANILRVAHETFSGDEHSS